MPLFRELRFLQLQRWPPQLRKRGWQRGKAKFSLFTPLSVGFRSLICRQSSEICINSSRDSVPSQSDPTFVREERPVHSVAVGEDCRRSHQYPAQRAANNPPPCLISMQRARNKRQPSLARHVAVASLLTKRKRQLLQHMRWSSFENICFAKSLLSP